MAATSAARRRAPRAQRASLSLWVWPTVSGVAGFVAAEVARAVDVPPSHPLRRVVWPGDTDAASTMAQVVAASAITVTTLTFSVTVVALQLASQQFSPRLLREFNRDPVTRVVLSVLMATLVFALTMLRHLRADRPPPVLAVTGTFVLGLLSLVSVLVFITHVVRILRIDSMMRAVHDETTHAIATFYADREGAASTSGDSAPARDGRMVKARESGFVRLVDVEGLVEAARGCDGFVRVEVRPGDHIVRGVPVATVWVEQGSEDTLVEAAHRTVVVSFERTLEQDAAFGFRQLEDIAVKALSPGINDPVTAAHAVGHMSDLLVRLAGCRLGPTVHSDEAGVARAVVPDRNFRYYLDLSCGQLRRYAAREPTVLIALLRMLRDVAVSAADDEQVGEVRRQADLVVATMDADLIEEDKASVIDLRRRVELALAGDAGAAFADLAGETRSV